MISKKGAHPKISIHSASQRASLNLDVNYATVIKYTCAYQISYKTEIFKSSYSMFILLGSLVDQISILCRIYIIFFCFSAWSKQVCYELTVEFSCNSMSVIIVLIVSIKFEKLTRKKYWF